MKNNHSIIKALLIALVAFVVTSCTFVQKEQTEDSALKITLPGNTTSRYAVNTSDISYFELTLKQDQNIVVDKLRASAGTTANLGIQPVGKYTLEGFAFASNGSQIAYKTEEIYIKAGSNTINFSLATTPYFLLWSTQTVGANVAKTYYISDISLQKKEIVGGGFGSCAFDTNNNLYVGYEAQAQNFLAVISNPLDNAKNESISKIMGYATAEKDEIPLYFSSVHIRADEEPYPKNNNTYINNNFTAEDGRMFFFGYGVSYKPGDGDNALVTFEDNSEGEEVIAYRAFVLDESNYKSTVYKTKIQTESSFNESKLNISYAPVSISSNTLSTEDNADAEFTFQDIGITVPEDFQIGGKKITYHYSLGDNITLKDSYIIGNKLYVLINYTNRSYQNLIDLGEDATGVYTGASSGALVEFNITEGSPTFSKTIGWNNKCNMFTYIQGDTNKYLFELAPVSSTQGFYGPKKILAIKPKKAWIADEGYILKNKMVLDSIKGKNVPEVEYERRIVEVDLLAGTFTNITKLPEEINLDNLVVNGSCF